MTWGWAVLRLCYLKLIRAIINLCTHNHVYVAQVHKCDIIVDMLENKVNEKVTVSSWNSPIVMTTKKDGAHRFCCDLKKLNKITSPVAYQIPSIEEIMAVLDGVTFFTALDTKSGYWCTTLSEDSKQ